MGKKVDKIKVELHGDTFVQLFGNNNISDLRQAIVRVKPGESKEAAWARHLFDNPLDENAVVKIFIVPNNHKSG
jgi:hypothetical protein